jgi:hypothetical protein
MALAKGHRKNLDTIIHAADARDLAVLECRDRHTREPVPVLAAVHQDDEGQFVFTPLARMFTGNPYEELLGPGEEDA